jgi:hypothetical protein
LREGFGAVEGNLRNELWGRCILDRRGAMIIKDKKSKKELDKVPDADKNGDPIFKIAGAEKERKRKEKERKPE